MSIKKCKKISIEVGYIIKGRVFFSRISVSACTYDMKERHAYYYFLTQH